MCTTVYAHSVAQLVPKGHKEFVGRNWCSRQVFQKSALVRNRGLYLDCWEVCTITRPRRFRCQVVPADPITVSCTLDHFFQVSLLGDEGQRATRILDAIDIGRRRHPPKWVKSSRVDKVDLAVTNHRLHGSVHGVPTLAVKLPRDIEYWCLVAKQFLQAFVDGPDIFAVTARGHVSPRIRRVHKLILGGVLAVHVIDLDPAEDCPLLFGNHHHVRHSLNSFERVRSGAV